MTSAASSSLLAGCLLCLIFTALLAPASAIIFKIKPLADSTYCLTGDPNVNDQPVSFAKCNSSNLYQSLSAHDPAILLQVITGISSFCGQWMCMTASTPGGDQTPIFSTACAPTNLAQFWSQSSVPTGAQSGYSHLKNWGTGFCATAELAGAYVDQYTCQPSIVGTEHQTWQIQNRDGYGLAPINNGMVGNTNCLNLKDVNPLFDK